MATIEQTYFGKSGHLFIMSELLRRGWNVAMPEVDEGDDIFVVQNNTGDFVRLQVKSSNGKKQGDGFKALFKIAKNKFDFSRPPVYMYVFLVRYNDSWQTPIIIESQYLKDNIDKKNIGQASGDNYLITLVFTPDGNVTDKNSKQNVTSIVKDKKMDFFKNRFA